MTSNRIPDRAIRLEGLDLLRGICAFSVMGYHYTGWSGYQAWHSLGTLTVYLFFVLSGYTLFHVYAHKPINAITLKQFWIARFFRIFPLFAFICLLYTGNAGKLILNISFLFGFTNPGQNSVAIGGWSIGIEYVFYFMFPLFWSFNSRKAMTWLFTIALLTGYFYVRRVFKDNCSLADCWAAYTQAVTFLPFFAGGCLMALYPRLPKTVPQAWLSSGAFTLLALTLWLPVHAFTESELFIKNPLFQLWILLFMFLVYLVAQIGITHNILRRIATSLGNLSYAVYLVHPFVWFNLDKTGLVLTENPLLFALTAFTLSTIAAQLLFKYIETPSREYGRKIAAGLRPAVSDQPSARQP